ncbi:MAG TPA: protein translocase subunit SecF [Candidatus Limnocylindria bacterium]|jgi:preprotein translocase subunit SecF|nr:protein translocase subunit SecF [Candidatus Limnocylindria bacterium]
MLDIVGKRRWYYLLSALLTLPGLVFVALGGLKPSVDFTGGTVWQVRYASDPQPTAVHAALVELGHPEAVVRSLSDGFIEIRTAEIGLLPPQTPIPSFSTAPAPSASGSVAATPSPTPSPTPVPSPGASFAPLPDNTQFARIEARLEDRFGEPVGGRPRSVTTIGPLIGAELIRSSLILIIVGEIVIMIYLAIRFGIRFGVAAIIALLHDVIVVVGMFAILGYFFGLEFDALFVTALLTIIGFSVHDTIVVFDRIRENRIRHAGEPFGAIVNHSILQTVGRSINTSLTVVVTLSALLLLGPLSIRTFTLALLIGVVSGTYSSIFNASQLLVTWYEWDASRRSRATGSRTVRPLSR